MSGFTIQGDPTTNVENEVGAQSTLTRAGIFSLGNGKFFIDVDDSSLPTPTAGIADGAVTAAKLASDAVTTAKILDSNVTTAKIAAEAVTDAKIDTTGGLGTYLRTVRAVSPTGVAATDTAAIVAALAAMTLVGGVVYLKAGTFAVNAVIEVPSNVTIRGAGRGVTIVSSSITPDGDPDTAVFHATASAASATTTLSAGNTLGARTISVAASVAAGSIITVNDTVSGAGLRTMSYDVQSVSGVGPYTLTLDRPVLIQYATSDAVGVHATQPTNLVIEDLTIQGSATRFIELVTAKNCVVRHTSMRVTSGASHDIVMSYDVGGHHNVGEDIDVDGGALAADCLALEGQEASGYYRCTVRNATAYGIVYHDCVHCVAEDCHASTVAFGFVDTADGTVKGSFGTRVRSGSFMGCTTEGISLVNGSADAVLTGVDARFNPKALTCSADVDDAVASGCNFSAHTTNAVSINTGATGIRLRDCNLTGTSATIPIVCSGDLTLDGCRIEACKQIMLATGVVTFNQCYLKCNPAAAQNVLYLSSGSPRVSLMQCQIECATNSCNVVSIAAGVCAISQTTVTAVGGATGVLGMYISAGSLFIGSGVDASGCATPLSSAGGTTKLVTETTVTSMASPS